MLLEQEPVQEPEQQAWQTKMPAGSKPVPPLRR